MRADVFTPGGSVVRRDLWFGRVWSAWPARLLVDDGTTITTVMWPGTRGWAPSTWVAWLNTGDASLRDQTLPKLVSRNWELAPWTWRSTISLRQVVKDRWFATTAFFDADSHAFKGWYLDFERPISRTPLGLDTRDLFLDLAVKPDSSWIWKDEEEYARALALGLVTEEEDANVRQARKHALELIRSGELLRGGWETWRLEGSWDVPTLPPGVLDFQVHVEGEDGRRHGA